MKLELPELSLRRLKMIRKVRRRVKDYRLHRRRARVAKKRRVGSRKATIVLSLILIGLFGAFAWAQNYLSPRSPGRQLSIDELVALGEEQRIATAIFRDEDNRLVGTYTATPIVVKEEQGKKGGTGKGEGNKKNASKGDKGSKNENAQGKGKGGKGAKGNEEPSKAPPGFGQYWLSYPSSDAAFGSLSEIVTQADARVTIEPQTAKGIVRVISTYLLPLLILANFFGLLFTAGRGGTSGIGDIIAFGAIGNKKMKRGFTAPVTFGDVGGADEAVDELKEVVDYLKDPERYEELGAVPPKGVLLFGPPGCGKTLMAKAVAGEAGVPFFSVAGAEFVESLVGVGAARVRDLFQKVRAVAPAIVFIDELDAAGRKRGKAGISGGGSDEREQTLNQLLVEMDGFEVSAGIVVMGATNRPDILDPALLRPGRFDRHITVDQPDAAGREEILWLHARGKPLAEDVDFDYLARRTPGFSGADLANVINEGALLTVRAGKVELGLAELEEAVQRVLHGPKRRGRMLSAEERTRIAYHEGGHALVAAALGEGDEVHRVSVLDGGVGLGATGILRKEETLLTADQLYERLVTRMAGLAAEELVLGQLSTGAEGDLEEATDIARDMIGRFGFNSRVGRMRLLAGDVEVYLDGESQMNDLAEETHREFDVEVRKLLGRAEGDALQILGAHRTGLDALVERLLKDETIEGAALAAMLAEVAPSPVRFEQDTPSRPKH